MISVYIFIVLGSVGLAFGLLLSAAGKAFAVETDPRIHEVEEVLPKGQCGACGYAGCQGYAEAVVKNPEVPTNLCIPGKDETARRVAEITGKNAAAAEKRVASIRCAGSHTNSVRVYKYKGIQGCVSANMFQGGNKACKYGCLGFGTCVKSCPFGAMRMSPEGLPVVNAEKCTGCGKCQTMCPRGVISLIPPEAKVRVNCSSHDKGSLSRQYCKVSCIGCKLCEKSCPHGAVKVENNLAVVNKALCIEVCESPVCYAKCPTKAIKPVVFGVVPGTEDSEGPLPTRFDHKSVE
jgi:Na+-translocating ferredoxin:NAD+ oxidoreductase RNF subunit RnfB